MCVSRLLEALVIDRESANTLHSTLLNALQDLVLIPCIILVLLDITTCLEFQIFCSKPLQYFEVNPTLFGGDRVLEYVRERCETEREDKRMQE